MTDPTPFDELASAHLDGATTAEEAARVEADPALRARVEELRAVRDAVGAVPPVDAAARDRAIAAAMAALDEDDAPAPAAPVTALAPRRGRSPRVVQAISAAAAILLIALLVPLLARGDRGDEDTAAGDASEESAGGQVTGDDAFAPGGAEAGGAAGSAGLSLGSFEDLDALAEAVGSGQLEDRAGPDSQPTTTLGEVAPPCRPPPGIGELVGTAVVAGEEVAVYIRRGADGGHTMTVVARPGCERIELRELD